VPSLREKIGKRVRAARLQLDLTQAELAGRLELEEPTVRSIEAGRRGVSIESLLRLADALRVTPGELLDLDPTKTTTIGQESARLIEELSPTWQKAVLRIVREVHGQVIGSKAKPTARRR
jgi:transcriptional regulator with XRE-family HTH domain